MGSLSGYDQRCVVSYNSQDLVSRAGFQDTENGLNVLCPAECSPRDFLTLMKHIELLFNERPELESKIAKICPLEKHEPVAEGDLEAFCTERRASMS